MSKDNLLKDTHPVLCESNRGSWSTCASNRILTISNGDTPPDYDELFHIDCFQNSVFEEGKGSKIQKYGQILHVKSLMHFMQSKLLFDIICTVRSGSLISGKDNSMPL